MSKQLELPLLLVLKTPYTTLGPVERSLIAIAYVTTPNVRRNGDKLSNKELIREHQIEAIAAAENLLKQGWFTRTLFGDLELTSEGRKSYEEFLEEERNRIHICSLPDWAGSRNRKD